jgi:hypothetical protein
MRSGIDDRHIPPQQPLHKLRFHPFELVVDQFVIQRTLLRQPPRAKGQPQRNRHSRKNPPRAICQRDVFPARRAGQESPDSLRQRSRYPRFLGPGIFLFVRLGNQPKPGYIDRGEGGQQNGAPPNMSRRFSKILVIRQRYCAIDFPETGAVQHLHQAALARIPSHVAEALIFLARLLAQDHPCLFFRQAHAFQKQALPRQSSKIPDRQQRILQVVQQSETQNEIKSAQLQDGFLFDVGLFERNMWKPAPCLRHVFFASVESAHIQAALRESLRKESHAAAGIHGVRNSQGRFQTGRNALQAFATSFDQLPILLLIESRQMNGDFRGRADGSKFMLSGNCSWAGAHGVVSLLFFFYGSPSRGGEDVHRFTD